LYKQSGPKLVKSM